MQPNVHQYFDSYNIHTPCHRERRSGSFLHPNINGKVSACWGLQVQLCRGETGERSCMGQGERVKHRMHDVSCIFFWGFSDLRFRVILGLRVNPKHRLAHNGGPTCHDQLEKPKKHRHARGILPRAKPGLLKYICGRRHALLSTGQRHKAQKAGVPAKNRMQGVQCMPCKHGEICEDR